MHEETRSQRPTTQKAREREDEKDERPEDTGDKRLHNSCRDRERGREKKLHREGVRF